MQVVLVGALELLQAVDVDARLRCIEILGGADDDTHRVDLVDDTPNGARNGRAGVAGDDRLHAGADIGRLGANQRHRLALHVRAHQGAVGVVVLEERNERRRDRNKLLRRDVHQVDGIARVSITSPAWRQMTNSLTNLPSSPISALAWAT